jgi:phosphatidylinositol alpha-mannosyltransferase
MKTLHLINGDYYSGAERVQDLLALNMPMFGYEVDFATLKPGRFAECRQSTQARLFEVPMRSRLDLRPALHVARLLRTGDYQLLHTHTARSAMIGRIAAALARRPLVHHVHSPAARDTQTAWRNLTNAAVERQSLAGANRLIAVSNSLRDYLEREGFESSRIAVVPNGVPVQERPVDWRAPVGSWIVGTVGFFRPRKGIEILVRALHLLLQQGVDVRLRAVGSFEEPAYRQTLVQLAEDLGVSDRIEWIEFTVDVGAELRQFDVFALPSLYGEGLPMALIEAMAIGLPVVATAVEGTPEVLTPTGAGLLVAPGDAHQLAEALTYLTSLGQGARDVGESGRRRQIERYSDTAMAQAVAKVYDSVIAPNASIKLSRAN